MLKNLTVIGARPQFIKAKLLGLRVPKMLRTAAGLFIVGTIAEMRLDFAK
jgi:hypothetical protein